MNRAFASLVALLASGAVPASAESPRSALEFFRGEWTVEGHESTYAESCDWLAGRGFIACHAEDRSEPGPSFSMSVFGYSESDGRYLYFGFSGSGAHRTLRGSRDEGVWRFHGESDRGPRWRRWQVTITPTPQGFHFLEEVSDLSGPWHAAADLEYLRKHSLPQ